MDRANEINVHVAICVFLCAHCIASTTLYNPQIRDCVVIEPIFVTFLRYNRWPTDAQKLQQREHDRTWPC